MKQPTKRCAIYTRKSSEEGLDQDFNSLDAQREACEAYILSQKHEGWSLVGKAYDDGGYSGGSINRPALESLMDDIKSGKIDSVVVYKIDRLTRSLMDFSKLVEIFDQHHVTFVSVTQSFNTTTSMGRLTLNVLLSFAQFEREVTGERIRDKIAASKKKGMWMGGSIPIGYDVKDRQLTLNPREAEKIKLIFDNYLKLGTVRLLKEYLDKQNINTQQRASVKGTVSGEKQFSRGHLYKILSNHTYIGQIHHKNEIHQGLHDAIIDIEVWKKVQAQLATGSGSKPNQIKTKCTNALKGKLFDLDGTIYSPSYTKKQNKIYRYYISQNLLQYKDHPKGLIARIPAEEIETILGIVVKGKLNSKKYLGNLYPNATGNIISLVQKQIQLLSDHKIMGVVEKVVVNPDSFKVAINTEYFSKMVHETLSLTLPEAIKEQAIFLTPYVIKRSKIGAIILQPVDKVHKSKDPLALPVNNIKKLVQGMIWRESHFNGTSLSSIANQNNCSWAYVSNCIDYSFNF